MGNFANFAKKFTGIEFGEGKETYHLSTKALAELINTDELIIEALENADYEGNSFLMLNLIATALEIKVEFELVSA